MLEPYHGQWSYSGSPLGYSVLPYFHIHALSLSFVARLLSLFSLVELIITRAYRSIMVV